MCEMGMIRVPKFGIRINDLTLIGTVLSPVAGSVTDVYYIDTNSHHANL